MQEKLLKDYEHELKGSGQGSKHAKKVPTGSALFSSYHQDTAFHTLVTDPRNQLYFFLTLIWISVVKDQQRVQF